MGRLMIYTVVALLCALAGLAVFASLRHMDTDDLFSPRVSEVLGAWEEICDTSFAPGANREEVMAALSGMGVVSSEDYRPTADVRKFYRISEVGNAVQINVIDKHVRNWTAMAELDAYTTIEFVDGEVVGCRTDIRRFGR